LEDRDRLALIEWLAQCNKDPLAFVLGAFPWGEPDTLLEQFEGPQDWQRDILLQVAEGLLTPNEAIQIAAASGHGIGKSALVAWIILWAFTTAPDTLGVVTANTETQLKTKTWARLGEWFNMFIGREMFQLTATALLSRDPSRERTWRIDMVPWSEKNTEAFAGLHNRGKRLVLIMDEGSGIPDVIYEVAEGALTDVDTEIMWFVFGNPTRNVGRFKDIFDSAIAKFWKTRQIDSRSVPITNKKQIQRWLESYGEDSDWFRVRVRGVFPRHGLMEFFSASEIDEAMRREVTPSQTAPLALGVDVARYGANNSVIFPRKGRDARSIPRRVYSGLSTVDLATRVFDAHHEYHADGIFIDGGGVGGGVVDNVRNMQLFCFEVQFGGKDDLGGHTWGNPGERYANKRAAMYGAARQWLKTGALPADPELRRQMLAVKYSFNIRDEILLESKEDMMDDNDGLSPDDLDAFVLTFAYPLAAHAHAGGDGPRPPQVETEWDPYDEKRMVA
jgi:hypothetical protein